MSWSSAIENTGKASGTCKMQNDAEMPTSRKRKFLGKNTALHEHFTASCASDFQKSQFSPAQVRADFHACVTCEKMKTGSCDVGCKTPEK